MSEAKSELADRLLTAGREFKRVILPVEVTEFDETVWVRSWDGKERAKWLDFVNSDRFDRDRYRHIRLIVATVCNEAGELLFDDGDLESLELWPATVLSYLGTKCLAVSGLANNSLADAVKNWNGTQS